MPEKKIPGPMMDPVPALAIAETEKQPKEVQKMAH
jgi:hypothetical protein